MQNLMDVAPVIRLHYMAKVKDFADVIKVSYSADFELIKRGLLGWAWPNQMSPLTKPFNLP